jgi:hypothetical protein
VPAARAAWRVFLFISTFAYLHMKRNTQSRQLALTSWSRTRWAIPA